MKLPWMALDLIYIHSETTLDLRDRLRILLGRKIRHDVELVAYPGHPDIGGIRTEVKETRVSVDPLRRPALKGGYATGEDYLPGREQT